MKLSDLDESMRTANQLDIFVIKHLDALAAKYDLKLRNIFGSKDVWTKAGGWYTYGVSTAHGWAKEESGDLDILPIEIRWKGFINSLIAYAHELAEAGRIVEFVKPETKYGNSTSNPAEPNVTNLENAKSMITMMDPTSGINRSVPAFMMYVSDYEN